MKRYLIICLFLIIAPGCHVSERSSDLGSVMTERFDQTARQMIACDLPHVKLEDYYGCRVWVDDKNKVHVQYHRDSDREPFKDRYGHCIFIRETVEVLLTPYAEMVSISYEKRPVIYECFN